MQSLFYLTSINKYLGKYYIYNPDEVDYYDTLEKEWQSEQHTYSFYQLLEIFPEAKPAIKKNLLEEIKRCKKRMEKTLQDRRAFNNAMFGMKYDSRWFWELARDFIYTPSSEEEKIIKRNCFYLSVLKPTKSMNNNRITEQDIQQAKDVSIVVLYAGKLRKQGNRLVGRCPFHNEKTGSFTIYLDTNRWHCFGCSAGADSIDFAMKRDGCDFITAVKKLINK